MAPKGFKIMSPRLQGVQILEPECSRGVYQKWRRSVRDALEKDGSWGHCDGSSTCPMPLPAGRHSLREEPQPGLLEQRRAWVKRDRDVKLDLFLSINDEIKMDVFDTGPPLPPAALTAKEMLEELDERFAKIKFEDFHHVYCHFLNLHIDHFATLEEFNKEYSSILQEMEDFGLPLHDYQAISAYFSKLRCTQNPWVVKQLKDWEDVDPPTFKEVISQAPPWIVIRPLACKTSFGQLSNHPANGSDVDDDYISSDLLSDLAEEEEDFSSSSGSEQAEITIHASAEDLQLFVLPPPPRNPRRANTLTSIRTTSSAALPLPKKRSKQSLKPTTPAPTSHPMQTQRPPSRSSSRQQTSPSKPKPNKSPTKPKRSPPPIDRPLPPLPTEIPAEPIELDSTPTTSLLKAPHIELPALPSPIELPATPLKGDATPPTPEVQTYPLELPATPETFLTWPQPRRRPSCKGEAGEMVSGSVSAQSSTWSLPLQGTVGSEVSPISEDGGGVGGTGGKRRSWVRGFRVQGIRV